MLSVPVQFHDIIRFYERVNKLKPKFLSDRERETNPDLLNISAEAKKKLVLEQARTEVLEKIRK
jgi:hypothetical protein